MTAPSGEITVKKETSVIQVPFKIDSNYWGECEDMCLYMRVCMHVPVWCVYHPRDCIQGLITQPRQTDLSHIPGSI